MSPLVCPNCKATVETDATDGEILCTACGSSFRVCGGTATTSYAPERCVLGKFDLLELVGTGSFGSVYRARDRELGRTVAVKVPRVADLPDKAEAQRFLREARSVAQLRHPTIVPVFEIGQESGRPYLVSEFVHGITLADLLTSERLQPRDASELVAELADALHYAHEQGVVHRDVKPSNVMLECKDGGPGRRYVPRLMDFGLAKRDVGEATMTVDGQVLGTPAYMSPEQARGDSHGVDGRSDVYSLGVILYQLLTGDLPFQGNARMLIHQVLHEEPKSPRQRDPKLPRDLETVCLKAMAKEPARRYLTALELAADLRRFLAGEPIRARRTSVAERLWRRVRRHPALAGLSTAVFVLVAALLAVVVQNGRLLNRRPERVDPRPIKKDPSGADELLRVVQELDRTDPGWRLDAIEAKRAKIPDEQNGALQIGRVAKALGEDRVKAKVADVLQNPAATLTPEQVAAFEADLRRLSPAFAEARKMADFPRGRYPTAYSRDVLSTGFPIHQFAGRVAAMLEIDAVLALHSGKRHEAVRACQGVVNCARSFGDDPLTVAQFLRFRIEHEAVRTLERLLRYDALDDSDLHWFQEAYREVAATPTLLLLTRGERGAQHYFMSSAEAGDVPLPSLLKEAGPEGSALSPSPEALRQCHASALRRLTALVEAAALPPAERRAAFARIRDEAPPADRAGLSRADQALCKYVAGLGSTVAGTIIATGTWTLASRVTTLAGLAAERYRLGRGSWPPNLAALVPEYLAAMPIDPYDGKPIRFRRTTDGVLVYSIGPNGADDGGVLWRGGVLDDKEKKPLPLDIGFELVEPAKRFNVTKR